KAVNTSRTGTWKLVSTPDAWKGRSRYSTTNPATFRWTPFLPVTGLYKVYAWWPSAANRAVSVPYRIRYKYGITTVTVNQRDAMLAGRWHLLGTFWFEAGNSGYVEVSGENGRASADAVRFVKR